MPTVRLAVTGLANAGKTIFITQLVSHLEHFKRSRFDLGAGRSITEAKRVSIARQGLKDFPYEAARRHLLGRDPDWPPATRDVAGIGLEFTLVDEQAWMKRRKYFVEIYDFPGELLADLNLPDQTFGDWSLATLRWLEDPASPAHAAARPYLDLLRDVRADSDPAQLVRAYHDCLEAAVRSGARTVSPAGWIYTRLGGSFSAPIDFAPLPGGVAPELRRQFQKPYRAYTRSLEPLASVFRECAHHIVLVDVLEILRDGQPRYIERKQALHGLVEFYKRSHGFLTRIARDAANWAGLPVTPGRIALSRAVIAATKADAVLEDDRGRLAGLLQEMLESDFRALDCQLDFRACAAYDATQRETDGKRWVIVGRVPAAPDQALPREVARVPESWPTHPWDGAEYRSFRNHLPPIPQAAVREDATFPHINLDEIFAEVMGLKPPGGARGPGHLTL
jgi:predicted YcjX-like family ATPase